jgi:hypothetical protein
LSSGQDLADRTGSAGVVGSIDMAAARARLFVRMDLVRSSGRWYKRARSVSQATLDTDRVVQSLATGARQLSVHDALETDGVLGRQLSHG